MMKGEIHIFSNAVLVNMEWFSNLPNAKEVDY
jgi:hypothetical protein